MPADEVNRPPIARTDLGRTRSGVPVLIEVVANDSDPDGDIIAAENIRSQPSGGTARIEDGAVVYTPSDTFTGTDRFTYALVDAGGEVAIGEVLVGVMPLAGANRAPEAFDDTVEAVAGSAPLVFDVLDNDSDADGDRVRVTTVGSPSSGAPTSPRTAGRWCSRHRRQIAAGDAEIAFTLLDRRRPRRHGVGDRHRRGHRCHRGRSPRSPSTTRSARSGRAQTRRGRPAGQRPRSRRQPGRARRRVR